MQTRTKVLAVAGVVVVVLVGTGTAVALTSGSDVADCYAGTGATPEGQQFSATLRLREDDGRVSGEYVASPSADVAVTYRVAGTLDDDDQFAGTFTAAGQVIEATGTITGDAARFKTAMDGDGRRPVDFRPGC